jgi:hypothetical protein
MLSVPSQCSREGESSLGPRISVGGYGDMMGAAIAIKIQKRIIAVPIVALFDLTIFEIAFRSLAIRDVPRLNLPPLFRRSPVADVDCVLDNDEFELSLIVRPPVQSPITQIECADS